MPTFGLDLQGFGLLEQLCQICFCTYSSITFMYPINCDVLSMLWRNNLKGRRSNLKGRHDHVLNKSWTGNARNFSLFIYVYVPLSRADVE